MPYEIITTTEGLPIFSWAKGIEPGAMVQAENLAKLPFAKHHVALMPDCHQGFGMPIGGILAAEGVIVPNAVGVDIGCGMIAVETSLTTEDLPREKLLRIMSLIRERIPVGFNHHKEEQDKSLMPSLVDIPDDGIVYDEYKPALKQIGTLGGGNHFIEIQKSDKGKVWLMIHSGSRNIGKKVADYHNKVAKELNAKWFSQVPAEWDLGILSTRSDEGWNYIREMKYCVEFAKANRKLMMERLIGAVTEVIAGKLVYEPLDVAHNYAALEHHMGQDLWIHRKGATRARKGELGIIPGSQGTASHIVRGLGNILSFESCSHGAGRKMGRNEARRTLDLETEKALLDSQGIVHAIRNAEDLDEAAGAYKDIGEVMARQSDLVEIVETLRPLAVIKG